MADKMTYIGVGVDYEAMDPFKRLAQRAGTVASSKIKKVIINPLGLEYLGSTLGVH
jgi:hypothetical protein